VCFIGIYCLSWCLGGGLLGLFGIGSPGSNGAKLETVDESLSDSFKGFSFTKEENAAADLHRSTIGTSVGQSTASQSAPANAGGNL
jgi:hypothetical protein